MLCGVCVGLGFETKMLVALFVVPGIALAWMWMRWGVDPAERLKAFRQLLAGGVAMTVVGLAWPLLVTLTPAADRPWISGTADNSIWSLIFGYNGIGRVAGQTGGPAAAPAAGPVAGRLRRQPVRRRHRPVPAARVRAWRPGRVAARVRGRRRARRCSS